MTTEAPTTLPGLKSIVDRVSEMVTKVDKYGFLLRGVKLANVTPTMLTAAVQMMKPDVDWSDDVSAKFLEVAKHFNEDDLDVLEFLKEKGPSVLVTMVTNRSSVVTDKCPNCGLVRYNIT